MHLATTKTFLLLAVFGVAFIGSCQGATDFTHRTTLINIACQVPALRNLDIKNPWKCRMSADPCKDKWAGVFCTDDRVTEINLSHLPLNTDVGHFDQIKHIESLHTFLVEDCGLTGSLPSAITHPTKALVNIDLRYQRGPCTICPQLSRIGGCNYNEYCNEAVVIDNDSVSPNIAETPIDTTTPETPITPTPVTASPTTVPQTSSSCGPVPPGPGYICTNGRWVFSGNLNVTDVADWNDDVLIQGNVNVPDGSQVNIHGLVTVDGNFTMDYSGVVCYTSFSFQSKRIENHVTRATVNGCATVRGNLTLAPSDEEISAIERSTDRGIDLLSSGCPLPIISIATVNMNKDQCKKVTGTSSTSSVNGRSTLNALLLVDSSGCSSPGSPPAKSSNTWRIAVGVSLGIVGLILAIFLIVVAASPSFRKKIQPYHKS